MKPQEKNLNKAKKSPHSTRIILGKNKVSKNVLIDYTKWIFKWIGIVILGFVIVAAIIFGVNQYNQHQELLKIEAKEFKERAARDCLAEQIPRAENRLKEFASKINPNSNLIEIKDNFKNLNFDLVVTRDNIKTKALVLAITTSCKSDFNFLININENENHQLTKFYVYAQNPPEGYKTGINGLVESLTRDFEVARDAKNTIKFDPDKFLSETQDHCAPNLSRQERLKRLATHGKVRESGLWTYNAGSSLIKFASSYDGDVLTCY